MADWPSTLPQKIQQQNFQISAPEGAIRTDMETGKPFQRRRFTAAVQPFSAQIWVDATQYSTLIDFWRNTLAMGALEFDWVHPITGDSATVRFIANEPFSITALSGDQYQVRMNLEIIP